MGFQGQLSSVNLADIFQTLQMNRQTGTLSVTGPAGAVHIHFDNGNIALVNAPVVDNRPFLLHALMRKGKLQADQADDLTRRFRSTGQNLRELVLASGFVALDELDEVCAWCIEETVCPVFEWSAGDFVFNDGPPGPGLEIADVVQMGRIKLATTQLVMEATRRKDEWRRIREVITDDQALYVVDNDGRANLRNLQTDPEMLKVLRYLDGRHDPDAVAANVGVSRFDTFAIISQLVLAGVARLRTPQELVEDAQALRGQNELAAARDLLENILRQARVPEVLRPLAEISIELNQVPRAVELYLELIQISQDQGQLDQALADLDKVLTLSPDDPDLHFERAQVQAELGNVEESAKGYSAAAQAYLGTKDLAKAIDACHRAKNLLPRAPEPHRYLARAYQMDGQIEGAVVEYKSLWHALLTAERPRKALESLKQILDQDCKYPAIKDQVLSHAQNSEAVKTSKATRYLVNGILCLVVVASGFAGWEYYKRVVFHDRGTKALSDLQAEVPAGKEAVEHQKLLERLSEIQREYSTIPEVASGAQVLEREIGKDYEDRADGLLRDARAAVDSTQFVKAMGLLADVERRYPGTRAAREVPGMRDRITSTQVGGEALKVVEEASARWNAHDWDGALAQLEPVAKRPGLPAELRGEVTKRIAEWSAALKSAQALGERAMKIEAAGDRKAALAAWRRAATGEGDTFVARAKAKVSDTEKALAEDLGRSARERAAAGDDQGAFAGVDELLALAKQASGREVQEVIAALELPFTVRLDHPKVVLTTKRAEGEQRHSAPAGTTGAWVQRLSFRLGESVAVTAARSGFTSQSFTISAQGRRTAIQIALARGPLWRKDLGATAVTPIQLVGRTLLFASNKATIEVVDPVLGTSRPVVFPDTVSELRVAPYLFQNRAYAVLDDRIVCSDITTRARLWTWPPEGRNVANRPRLNGHLAVLEHELIQGQLLIFAGTLKGGLLAVAADTGGAVTPYPRTALDNDLTGTPYVDRSTPNRTVLYVPAGNEVRSFDIAAITERSGPAQIAAIATKGDVVGRLMPATAAGRQALLAADAGGLVEAIDLDLGIPETKRVVGAWPVDGVPVGLIAVSPDQPVAWCAVAEGRCTALDLAHPGAVLWRFPAQGSLAALNGGPALGAKGLYLADANGTLVCIDQASGAERWRADLGSPAVAGPCLWEGRVYVPLKSGALVCFEEGD